MFYKCPHKDGNYWSNEFNMLSTNRIWMKWFVTNTCTDSPRVERKGELGSRAGLKPVTKYWKMGYVGQIPVVFSVKCRRCKKVIYTQSLWVRVRVSSMFPTSMFPTTKWCWLSNPTPEASARTRSQSNLLLSKTAVPKIAVVWFDWGNMHSAVKASFFSCSDCKTFHS